MAGANLTLTNAAYSVSSVTSFGQCLSAGYGASNAAAGLSGVVTIEARVTLASAPGGNKVAAGQGGLGWVGVNSSGVAIGSYGGANNTTSVILTSSVNIADGAPHHLAIVINTATGGQLYVDGVLAASSAVLATGGISFTATNFGVRDLGGVLGSFTWTGTVDEVALFSGARYSGNFQAPSAPYAGTETNLVSLYHLDGNGTDAIASTAVPADNANILYSPGNWVVGGGQAKTINAGAYFRTVFSGGSATLNFNTAAILSPAPELWISVDGVRAQYNLASTITITPPASNLWGKHTLEFAIKSTTTTHNRWNGADVAIVFTGLTLASGGALYPVTPLATKILVFGDSITEGNVALQGVASSDVDDGDATMSYAYAMRHLMGAEVGVIGFGSAGVVQAGAASVPNLQSSFAYQWSGQARTFPAGLGLVVLNIGTNDARNNFAASSVTAGLIAVLNGLLAAVTCPVAVMKPFFSGGAFAAPAMTSAQFNAMVPALQAAIAGCAAPSRVSWVATDGLFDGVDSYDGLHPYGVATSRTIAPAVAASLNGLLHPVSAGRTYTYR